MTINENNCEHKEMALPPEKVTELLREVPGWLLKDRAIERDFKFGDFRRAMEFVNGVASLSEAEAHHPDISISYNRVHLSLSTHKIGALSCKDFILASRINYLSDGKDRQDI